MSFLLFKKLWNHLNQIEDNTEFFRAVQDYSPLNSFYDSFRDLVLNPYVLTSPLVNSPDLDPDNHFYAGNNNVNHDSKYVHEERFKTKLSSNPNTFSLMHILMHVVFHTILTKLPTI